MPTYVIEGKTIKTEKPLSEEEIDEIGLSLKGSAGEAGAGRGKQGGPTAAELERHSNSNYFLNSAKKGALGLLSLVGSGLTQGRHAPDAFLKDWTVDTDLQPVNKTQKYGGAIVEGTFDPTNAIGFGITAPVKAGAKAVAGAVGSNAANLGGRAALGGVAGGAGELGGEVGQAAGGSAGQVIGGITFAMASTFGVGKVASLGYDKAKGISNSVRNLDPNQVAGIEGTSKAQALYKQAIENNPDLAKRLAEVQERIALVTGKPGNLAAAGLDDITLHTALTNEAKTNVKFAGELQKLYDDLQVAVKKTAQQMFPAPNKPLSGAAVKQQAIEKRATQKAEVITKKLEDLTAKVDLFGTNDPRAFGQAAQNLVLAREKAVTAVLSPKYEDVLKQASAQGARLGQEDTRNLLNAAETLFLNDPWAQQHPLLAEVRRVAKQAEATIARNANDPAGQVFMDASTLDSLKQRVNDELRTVKNSDRHDKLTAFKKVLNHAFQKVEAAGQDAVVKLDGQDVRFGDAMKQIDTQYYEQVGIPFRNPEALQKLKSTDYAERIGGQIATSPTALDDFLRAAGDDGIDIAQKAVMARLHNKALDKDGILDPKKLEELMTKDSQNGGFRDILNRVPELRSTLNDARTNSTKLQTQIKALNDAAKDARAEMGRSFLADYDRGGVDAVVSKVTGASGKGYWNKFQSDLSKLPPEKRVEAVSAVQNGLVTKMLDQGDPLKYLKDHQEAFSNVFGAQHTKNLLALADVASLARKIDVAKLPFSATAVKEKGLIEEATGGIEFKKLAGVAVNQIASIFNKSFRLATMVGQAQIEASTREAHRRLFLDQDGVQQIMRASTKMLDKNGKEVDLTKFLQRGDAHKLLSSIAVNTGRNAWIGGKVAASESEVTPLTDDDEYVYTGD